jgi:hypothetical protein
MYQDDSSTVPAFANGDVVRGILNLGSAGGIAKVGVGNPSLGTVSTNALNGQPGILMTGTTIGVSPPATIDTGAQYTIYSLATDQALTAGSLLVNEHVPTAINPGAGDKFGCAIRTQYTLLGTSIRDESNVNRILNFGYTGPTTFLSRWRVDQTNLAHIAVTGSPEAPASAAPTAQQVVTRVMAPNVQAITPIVGVTTYLVAIYGVDTVATGYDDMIQQYLSDTYGVTLSLPSFGS